MIVIHPALALAAFVAAAPSARDKSEARVLKNEAFQKIAEGSYGEGVDLLRRAHDAVPHPNFLFNIAVVYDQWSGHCAESLAAFDEFFAACEACDARATAEARVERVRAKCTIELDLVSVPIGAEVTVDDEPRGPTPISLGLLPGAHRLRLEAEGFEPDERRLLVEEGAPMDLSITLTPTPAPTSNETSDVTTSAAEGKAPRPGRGLRTAGWVALGVGAVGTGLGIAFTVLTNEAVDEERRLTNTAGVDPADVRATRDAARDRAVLAYVTYGVGIAGVASGVLLHVLAGRKDRRAHVGLSTDGHRLLLSGRF